MPVAFGDCVLDVAAHELTRQGAVVPVEPQVFAVLAYLARHRERVVPKTELLDEVWGDRFVSESALSSRIKSARRAVGDTGRDQRIIRTVHGRGYRFVAPVADDETHARAGADGPVAAPDGDGTADPDGDAGLVARVLADLGRGRGAAIAVVGGPAARPTALVDAVYEAAARAGHLVGRGSGAGAGLRPYGCVLDAVDELAQRRPELLDALPGTWGPELAKVLAGAAPAARTRLFLMVREALVAAAAAAPTLVVVDELHYADPDTLALVDHVAALARHHGVVLLVAHRPGVGRHERYEIVSLAEPDDDGTAPVLPPVPAPLLAALRLVALEGRSFDEVAFRAAAGRDDADALLDGAVGAGVVEAVPGGHGYRFAVPGHAEDLVAGLPPHRRAQLHADLAERLADGEADPARVAHHLLAARRPVEALPYATVAARRAAADQRYPDVIRWTGAVVDLVTGDDRVEMLALRAEALVGTGDATAIQVYRDALALAEPAAAVPLRAGLARAAVLAGDLDTAEEALAGIGGDAAETGAVLLGRAMVRYYRGDLDGADELLDRARAMALAPGAPVRLLDAITLQGLIAHNRGMWFDRLRRELRTTRDSPDLAVTVFDSHLCVAEYLLYGPTPYAEVVTLARELEDNAARRGARRAVAFAVCVAGEAQLLAGDLDGARADLTRSVALHRELGADAGTALSLQRLAEVELAVGDPSGATERLREALPLARWSPLAQHLLQRLYGTLIAAAPDLDAALAVVDEAAQVLDRPPSCEACQVMVEVPAAIACAVGGRLDEARTHLERAELSARLWEGAAWPGAVTEARAAIARAEGEDGEADALLTRAAALFDQAGQPLDAARCREALGD